MERKLIMYVLPLFALAILIDFLIDVIKKTNRYKIQDSITSLSAGFLGTTAGLLAIGFVGFFYNGVFRWLHIFDVKDTVWSWVLAVVIYDFFFYWYHRAHHRINFLWAIHATHHNSEYFNFTTALRQSALGFLTVWPFFLLMAFLGFSYEHYLFAAGLSTLYGFFTHTEFVRFVPYLELILVGPSSHRVHHGINPRYVDKNYGSIFIVWDHVFGTHAYESKKDKICYGTSSALNSFNPFWANLSLFWSLLNDMYFCKSWKDKFTIWFKKTGWRPEDRRHIKDANKKNIGTFKIYNKKINSAEYSYVIVSFIFATLSIVHLMFSAKYYSTLWVFVYVLLIWSVLLSNSFFMDGKIYRFKYENIRLIIVGIYSFYAVNNTSNLVDYYWFNFIFIASCTFSLGWVALYIYKYIMPR